jgi:hypothetical protein
MKKNVSKLVIFAVFLCLILIPLSLLLFATTYKEHKGKKEYAIRSYHYLKTTDSEIDASLIVGDLRRAIEKGDAKWTDFGEDIDIAKIDLLFKEAQKRNAIRNYQRLSDSKIDIVLAGYAVDQIRKSIKDGILGWQELGEDASDSKLNELVNQAQRIEAIKNYLDLQNSIYSLTTTEWVAERIRKAINDGVLSWSDLGTDASDAKLDELVRVAGKNDVLKKFREIGKTYYSPNTAKSDVLKIRKAIAEGLVKPEELVEDTLNHYGSETKKLKTNKWKNVGPSPYIHPFGGIGLEIDMGSKIKGVWQKKHPK